MAALLGQPSGVYDDTKGDIRAHVERALTNPILGIVQT